MKPSEYIHNYVMRDAKNLQAGFMSIQRSKIDAIIYLLDAIPELHRASYLLDEQEKNSSSDE